jgi:hypothetical protein
MTECGEDVREKEDVTPLYLQRNGLKRRKPSFPHFCRAECIEKLRTMFPALGIRRSRCFNGTSR